MPNQRGVRVRKYPSGREAIEIQFQWRGIQCKEILPLDVTRSNMAYANDLKRRIEEAKTKGEFRYMDFFPDSPRCATFGEIKPADPTINQAMTQWKADMAAAHEKSTVRQYLHNADACIQHLGNYKLTELATNPEPIRNMVREWAATLKTIRNRLTPLRAIFDAALSDDIITRNPMDRIKVAKLANNRKESTYTVDPLNEDEIANVLKTASIIKPRWKNYFQFAFYSGLRTSELYALRWRDVDFKSMQIHVQNAVVERHEKGTKTSAGTRSVDLLPMAAEALLDEYNTSPQWGKPRSGADHVFINPTTRKPITDYDHSRRAWKAILDEAGVRYRNQYQTRHSYCSNKLSGGENIFYMATQMGHADTEMIIKHYAKYIRSGQGNAARREFVSPFGKTP